MQLKEKKLIILINLNLLREITDNLLNLIDNSKIQIELRAIENKESR